MENDQKAVRRMLPTRSQRYKQATILAIDFSVSSLEAIRLRDELLKSLNATSCSITNYTGQIIDL